MTWLRQFRHDLRFGFRNLGKNPGFTAVAVVSLALGIGATTAMYSVIHAVILDPFPYRDVDSLMSIQVHTPGQGGRTGYTVDQFLEFRDRSSIFEGVAASTISDVTWTDAAEPQRLRGNHVPMDAFDVMGVPPLIGRVTSAADAAPGAEPVAVLGYRFWVRQFGGDSNVLGKKLRLNNVVRTVIGVMPQRFMWRGADVYIPVVFRGGEIIEGVRYVHVVGRVKKGVTASQAEADLRPIIEELRQREPAQFPENWRVRLLSFKETFPSGIRDQLWILFGAVGLLLLIACVNVSNLLLTRASGRAREMAIRASLGATRGRIVRQLLAESLLIALAGGLLGVGMAFAGLKGILAMVPPNTIPDEAKVAINLPVLLFSMGVSVLAALLAGLAPALHVSSTGNTASPLREASRGVAGSARQRMARNVLAGCEVALSLILLVGASLMMRTMAAVQTLDLGFAPERILTLRIPMSQPRYPNANQRNAFLQQVLERLETLPGVRVAGVNTWMHPMGNWNLPVTIVGSAQQDNRPAIIHQTNEHYTEALGINVVSGRMFTKTEIDRQAYFAVVNDAFVRQFIPDRQAIGRIVRIPQLRASPFNLKDDSFEIIGIVQDRLNRISATEMAPELYIPYTVTGTANYLVIAASLPPDSIAKSVSAQIYAVDRDQPVMDVRSMETVLADFVYARPRFNLLLFGIFASAGLLLALCGVYGVISHSVAQQTREIGVRIALGATLGQVTRMVLASGARIVGFGIVAGLIGSLAGARLLENLVWKLSTFDPISFGGVALLLFAAGLAACIVPALRAARVDPAVTLRSE